MGNLIANAPLFYPSAKEWMWNYCIYLGPFIDSSGNEFDLGIYIDKDGAKCAANVYGNEPGNYYSGDLPTYKKYHSVKEHYEETFRRAKELGLILVDDERP